MRGDLPVKKDTEVTEADIRTKNLILFGDPGSNPWIARALPKLPVTWTREKVKLGAETYAARDHAPALISASPFEKARDRTPSQHRPYLPRAGICRVQLPAVPRLGDWA
jgi:hypothetical protein